MPAVPPGWLLFTYRLPPAPSRLRLAIWRRLKRLGALLYSDAVWVLPAGAETREALEWLAEEIEEFRGSAWTWEGTSLASEQDTALIQRFRAEAEARYRHLIVMARRLERSAAGGAPRRLTPLLRQSRRRLSSLERALRLERRRDYFKSPARAEADAAIGEAARLLRARLAQSSTRRPSHAVGDSATLPR